MPDGRRPDFTASRHLAQQEARADSARRQYGSADGAQVDDRLADDTGAWEVVGRPHTTAVGKNAHVRVRRVVSDVTMIRTYGAHERISVKRASAEEGKR